MNPMIDKLLTDRALGELPPEAAWLLDRYLAEHPEYCPLSRQTEETIRLARLALSEENATGKPMSHVATVRRVAGVRPMRLAGRAASLAACVLLGVWIGLAVGGRGDRPIAAKPEPPAVSAAGASAAMPGAALASGTLTPGFWSTHAWAGRAWQRVEPTGGRVVEWDGPFVPRWKRGVQ